MIRVQAKKRPRKEDLARRIAEVGGFNAPAISSGSSVSSLLMREIYDAAAGLPMESNVYAVTAATMDHFGLTYDPNWDTSEGARSGGGTVTSRAFSQILAAITREPRCFIVDVTDLHHTWATRREEPGSFSYRPGTPGHPALNDAGPGSLLLFRSIDQSSTNGSIVGAGRIRHIGPGWTGPWVAELERVCLFPKPLAATEFQIMRDRRSITEIDLATFSEFCSAGGIDHFEALEDGGDEPIRDYRALRLADDLLNSVGEESVPTLSIPPRDDLGRLDPATPLPQMYEEVNDTVRAVGGMGWTQAKARDSASNKEIEQFAVDFTIRSMQQSGWRPTADRQKDGVGYDLEFENDQRRICVEVKGIASSRLVFNLTPKELWQASTNPDWLLVAVTNISNRDAVDIRVLPRDAVTEARRAITGFKLDMTRFDADRRA